MTVLHRLMVSGPDRGAMRWRRDRAIGGVDGLDLHHMHRATGRLRIRALREDRSWQGAGPLRLGFRLIIFLQAIRTVLPPLGNDFVALVKRQFPGLGARRAGRDTAR